MIKFKDKIKIWSLTAFDILAPYVFSIYLGEELSILDFLLTLPIIFAAYVVTEKNKKWGVWLWVFSFSAPRLFNPFLFCYFDPGFLSVIRCVSSIGFCMLITRYFLLWSLPSWKKPNSNPSLKFWKGWLFLEEALVIVLAVILSSLLMQGIGLKENSIAKHLPILGVVALYKRIKKQHLKNYEISSEVFQDE